MSAATMTHFINLHASRELSAYVGKRVRLIYAGTHTFAALVELEDGRRVWLGEHCLTPIGEGQS